MTMEGYRREIGEIDRQLVALFARRMAMSAGIAREKTAMGLPVPDPAREQERLAAVCAQAGPDLAGSTAALYTAVLALSRAAQYACPAGGPGLVRLTLAGPRTQGGLYALLAQMEAMAVSCTGLTARRGGEQVELTVSGEQLPRFLAVCLGEWDRVSRQEVG